MGATTKIAWTDHTFNPWIGCTKVSAGCDHCYAETLNHRWGNDNWGKGKPRRLTSNSNWREPLKWNKAAEAAGIKAKVFCASLADVMDDEAPEGARERLWGLIDITPNLIWQLLTKRPQRYTSYLPPDGFRHENVWLGTSAENQHFYDIRWGVLRIIAKEFDCVSWISYEPALGPLSMIDSPIAHIDDGYVKSPDWIICGGESGPGHRSMDQKWAENIQCECEGIGVKFFMKQMSAATPDKGKDLIPAHLLIREFPQ